MPLSSVSPLLVGPGLNRLIAALHAERKLLVNRGSRARFELVLPQLDPECL